MPSEVSTHSIVIAASIALALLAVIAIELSIRRKTSRRVHARSALTATQFATLFADPEEATIAPLVRDQLRGYITVDPALVRPDDKLCADLQLAAIDGMDANTFVADVEAVTATRIPDEVAARMLTLRDIISFVAKVRHERAT